MLTPEQIAELKHQLYDQVKHLPAGKRQEAEEAIEDMSPEALESMLKQQQQKIFRDIVNRKISAQIVEENEDALAVLEIRPISKGHVMIIPKKETTNEKSLAPGVLKLAEHIANKLTFLFKPKNISIRAETKLGEVVLDLIPIYEDKQTNERKPASEKDLEKLAKDLITLQIPAKEKTEVKEEKPKEKKARKPRKKILKMPRRIP